MKNKKRNLSIGLIAAVVGVIMLSVVQFNSANSLTSFTQPISIITIIALAILLFAGAWLFWMSFQ